MATILTLEARDNVMLNVMFELLDFNRQQMLLNIQQMHESLIGILSKKGVTYQELKPALIPKNDRQEAAFVFDTQQIQSAWYGLEVFEKIFPFLTSNSIHAILHGDILVWGKSDVNNLILSELVVGNGYEPCNETRYYAIYVNGLSDSVLGYVHSKLLEYSPYVGYIPCTYASKMKTYLSFCLVSWFIKYKEFILVSHSDDLPDDVNVCESGYPFEQYGCKVVSLPRSLYVIFLVYKIERAVYPGFDDDFSFSLNSVCDYIVPFSDMTVVIEEEKYEYLTKEKIGSIKRAGVLGIARERLEEMIRERLVSNYIYNISLIEKHNVIKFNIILEFGSDNNAKPARITVAMEYKPQEKILRIITLY